MPVYIEGREGSDTPPVRIVNAEDIDVFGAPLPIAVGQYVEREFTVPVLTGEALDAADVVSSSLIVVPECVRVNGGAGRIVSFRVLDLDYQTATLEFWLFREPLTPPAADAAWTLTDGEARKRITVLYPGPAAVAGTASYHYIDDSLSVNFRTATNDRSLYIVVVARTGTPTITTGGVTGMLGIRQD